MAAGRNESVWFILVIPLMGEKGSFYKAKELILAPSLFSFRSCGQCLRVCVCICVCVCEGERDSVCVCTSTWPPCRTGWTSLLIPTAKYCCWGPSPPPQPSLSPSSSLCYVWAARGELHTQTHMLMYKMLWLLALFGWLVGWSFIFCLIKPQT